MFHYIIANDYRQRPRNQEVQEAPRAGLPTPHGPHRQGKPSTLRPADRELHLPVRRLRHRVHLQQGAVPAGRLLRPGQPPSRTRLPLQAQELLQPEGEQGGRRSHAKARANEGGGSRGGRLFRQGRRRRKTPRKRRARRGGAESHLSHLRCEVRFNQHQIPQGHSRQGKTDFIPVQEAGHERGIHQQGADGVHEGHSEFEGAAVPEGEWGEGGVLRGELLRHPADLKRGAAAAGEREAEGPEGAVRVADEWAVPGDRAAEAGGDGAEEPGAQPEREDEARGERGVAGAEGVPAGAEPVPVLEAAAGLQGQRVLAGGVREAAAVLRDQLPRDQPAAHGVQGLREGVPALQGRPRPADALPRGRPAQGSGEVQGRGVPQGARVGRDDERLAEREGDSHRGIRAGHRGDPREEPADGQSLSMATVRCSLQDELDYQSSLNANLDRYKTQHCLKVWAILAQVKRTMPQDLADLSAFVKTMLTDCSLVADVKHECDHKVATLNDQVSHLQQDLHHLQLQHTTTTLALHKAQSQCSTLQRTLLILSLLVTNQELLQSLRMHQTQLAAANERVALVNKRAALLIQDLRQDPFKLEDSPLFTDQSLLPDFHLRLKALNAQQRRCNAELLEQAAKIDACLDHAGTFLKEDKFTITPIHNTSLDLAQAIKQAQTIDQDFHPTHTLTISSKNPLTAQVQTTLHAADIDRLTQHQSALSAQNQKLKSILADLNVDPQLPDTINLDTTQKHNFPSQPKKHQVGSYFESQNIFLPKKSKYDELQDTQVQVFENSIDSQSKQFPLMSIMDSNRKQKMPNSQYSYFLLYIIPSIYDKIVKFSDKDEKKMKHLNEKKDQLQELEKMFWNQVVLILDVEKSQDNSAFKPLPISNKKRYQQSIPENRMNLTGFEGQHMKSWESDTNEKQRVGTSKDRADFYFRRKEKHKGFSFQQGGNSSSESINQRNQKIEKIFNDLKKIRCSPKNYDIRNTPVEQNKALFSHYASNVTRESHQRTKTQPDNSQLTPYNEYLQKQKKIEIQRKLQQQMKDSLKQKLNFNAVNKSLNKN